MTILIFSIGSLLKIAMSLRLPPRHICHGLMREVSRATSSGIKSERHNYILEKYRENQVTSARYCRAIEEANHDAATYWCLLRSTRELDELIVKYHGTGEKTTEQAANLVGLKLPEDYAKID